MWFKHIIALKSNDIFEMILSTQNMHKFLKL